MALKLTDLSDRGPDTSSQQFTHFNSFRSVRAMFCIFADMCCFLCYIIGDKTDQKRFTKTSVTLTFVLRWYVCVVSEASRSQQQPVSLRYVRRAQPPVVREDGSDFISSLHCNRGQRTLLCILSSHRFWFYQRCIGCFILPQRLGFLHVSLKTLLFGSSAVILSAHRSRSYTGTLWSVSFIDIDFIRGGFLCLGIVLHWFSKEFWVMGALFIVGSIVDSCNRSTVATGPTSYCKRTAVQFIALVVILSAKAAASQRHLRAQKFFPGRWFTVIHQIDFIRTKHPEEISVYFLGHRAFICCFFIFRKKHARLILGLLYQFCAVQW